MPRSFMPIAAASARTEMQFFASGGHRQTRRANRVKIFGGPGGTPLEKFETKLSRLG